MIAFYSNNCVTDYWISKLNLQEPYRIHHEITDYQADSADKKIAFVNEINHYDTYIQECRRAFNNDHTKTHPFVIEVERLKDISNRIFLFEIEFHDCSLKAMTELKLPNVVWAVPAVVNDTAIIGPSQAMVYNAHFNLFMSMYRRGAALHAELDQLEHDCVKPKLFDALLGRTRIHRDFVYHQIKANNMQSSMVFSYVTDDCSQFVEKFLWPGGTGKVRITDGGQPRSSVDYVDYCGIEVALSRILPVEIYNQTAYSIVAETNCDNRYSFFTEKTAKPILAKRLFVVFSGVNFLKNLRSVGFRTFDSVIDESYDSIVSDYHRWAAAFDQVKRLCKMDQREVFETIKPVVEHNYSLIMDIDWQDYLFQQIRSKLSDIIQ